MGVFMKKTITKIGMFFCGMITFISSIAFASEASGELYPFSENVTLSWSEFERNFRQKYAHLKIPVIKVLPNAPGCMRYSPDHNIIQLNPRLPISAAHAELVLLHETGHSYVDPIKRSKNHKDGEIAVKKACVDMQANTSLLQKTLAVMNGAHLLYKGPNIRLLSAFGLIKWLSDSPDVIRSCMYDRVYPKYACLPEEIMADDFANQHASKEALRAGLNAFSKKGIYDLLQKESEVSSERCRNLIENELKKSSPDHDLIGSWKRLERSMAWTARMPFIYEIQNCIDVSHPSMPERQDAIRKALRERFGVGE